MGPIQTALGQALGAVGGATLMAKKMYDNEGQVIQKETTEETTKKEDAETAAKVVKVAQDKKLAQPKQIIYDIASGAPLATSGEMASLLSRVSYANALNSKQRSKQSFQNRLAKVKASRAKLKRRD